MYTEADPLLPRDKPAPEIHGSRASTINDIDDQNSPDIAETKRRQGGLGEFVALCIAFLTLTSLFLIIFPDGFELDARPRTIEHRVTKILTKTPLIGKHF